ncbi:hypothetical protein [Halomicrococcus sp. NG-SE-24]|uniref:hypothetical protein n=1 Tax=Halomicrococcus sp. NG-SE-24 TaxID=3436928 RepID=UPI003D9807D9
MNSFASDSLGSLGTVVGVFLALVGIATLVGTPWAYKSGSLVLAAGQIFGALAAVGVGAGLAWLATQK